MILVCVMMILVLMVMVFVVAPLCERISRPPPPALLDGEGGPEWGANMMDD